MPGYTPTEDDHCAILGMLRDIIVDRLQSQGVLELQNIAFPALTGIDCPSSRRLEERRNFLNKKRAEEKLASIERHLLVPQNALYLPVEITVTGPSGEIAVAYEQILDIAEEMKEELEEKLKDYESGKRKCIVGFHVLVCCLCTLMLSSTTYAFNNNCLFFTHRHCHARNI